MPDPIDNADEINDDRARGSSDAGVDRGNLEPVSDSQLSAIQRAIREQYRMPGLQDYVSSRARPQTQGESLDSQDGVGVPTGAHGEGEAAAGLRMILNEVSRGLSDFPLEHVRVERSPAAGAAANHYMLGTEFAIVAIVAMAGLAKRRADLSFAGLGALSSEDEISHSLSSKQESDGKVLYRAPKRSKSPADRSAFKFSMGDETPEWMISLDGSAAAEAGYLYASVLRRPKILITQSDTFVSLAEKHFHDPLLAWLIADLNLKKLREVWKKDKRIVVVSNGETIELPVWEDIVEFYQHKPKIARIDNLITVVLKRTLDRQLLEAELAAILAPEEDDL